VNLTPTTEPHDLAGMEHWDGVWAVAPRRPLSPRSYYTRRLDEVFSRYLRPGAAVFEAGAGGSRWLPYLATRFSCRVNGMDYSEPGVRAAREHLRQASVAGTVTLGNVLEPHPDLERQFDLVWSAGLIEHFDDPARVVGGLARFLRPGAVMVTLVPNLQGAVGRLHRVVDAAVYRMHRVLDPADLDRAHAAAGLVPVEPAAYFGVFSLGVANWSRLRFRLPRWLDGLFWSSVLGTQQLVCGVASVLGVRPESRTFSPYVVGVYRRP